MSVGMVGAGQAGIVHVSPARAGGKRFPSREAPGTAPTAGLTSSGASGGSGSAVRRGRTEPRFARTSSGGRIGREGRNGQVRLNGRAWQCEAVPSTQTNPGLPDRSGSWPGAPAPGIPDSGIPESSGSCTWFLSCRESSKTGRKAQRGESRLQGCNGNKNIFASFSPHLSSWPA